MHMIPIVGKAVLNWLRVTYTPTKKTSAYEPDVTIRGTHIWVLKDKVVLHKRAPAADHYDYEAFEILYEDPNLYARIAEIVE